MTGPTSGCCSLVLRRHSRSASTFACCSLSKRSARRPYYRASDAPDCPRSRDWLSGFRQSRQVVLLAAGSHQARMPTARSRLQIAQVSGLRSVKILMDAPWCPLCAPLPGQQPPPPHSLSVGPPESGSSIGYVAGGTAGAVLRRCREDGSLVSRYCVADGEVVPVGVVVDTGP